MKSPRGSETCYHVDLVVSCSPHERGEQTVDDPVIIFEVLSPSTESHDRKVKLVDYREIPTVKEIVLVDQDRRYCEVHRRMDDGRWLLELLRRTDSKIRLESVDVELSLSDAYENVALSHGEETDAAS